MEDHKIVGLSLSDDELPSPHLLKAIGLALARRVNRSPLRQWVMQQEKISEADWSLILQEPVPSAES